jgi:glutamyl/glutaminyl-tRNA synthetase
MSGVRFAPSPTGSFHIGNLRTAWISWRLAQKFKLPWIVRFEDIDQPRVVSGAQEEQLRDMSELGLVPDQVLTQSADHLRHWELFQKAVASGQVYPCTCSRKEIQSALEGLASAPHMALGSHAPLYGGKCRQTQPGVAPKNSLLGWRFRADDPSGAHDFIVARTTVGESSSFVPSYHWACAIDDYDGAYDMLVRAADLRSATDIQRKIQSWLSRQEGRPELWPAVFHTSLVVQNDGHRLEKRTAGVTLGELKKQGWTAQKLVELFEKSFRGHEPQGLLHYGEISGEPADSLTLEELGIHLRPVSDLT